MTNYIKEHEKWISGVLGVKQGVRKEIVRKHSRKIMYLQHERLIHLLITLFYGLVEVALVLFVLSMPGVNWLVVLLAGIVGVLLIFYVGHYYLLENTVQRWYGYADKLEERTGTIRE